MPQRITVREGVEEEGLVDRLAYATSIHPDALRLRLLEAGGRARSLLGLDTTPLEVRSSGTVRIDGVAGLLRLTPNIEMQVVPKFLDPTDAAWQEDFFLLAMLSEAGRVLPRESLRAGYSDRGDLASLVGRTLVQLYWTNRRRPVRTYRRRLVEDYSYAGDLDIEDLWAPEPGGFRQTQLQLTHQNEFNAIMAAAVRVLLPEVRDSETRKQLLRVYQQIGPQAVVGARTRAGLPARHREWQPALDLSRAVLRGLGVGLSSTGLFAPGFLLRTWEAWENLVEVSVRSRLSDASVSVQRSFTLGHRHGGSFEVKPDIVVGSGDVALVVDAKYKGRAGGTLSVTAADVYESLAFLRATGANRAVLVYPRLSREGPPLPVGSVVEFERVRVGPEDVIGIQVECRGLSRAGGFESFASGLASALRIYVQ